MGHWRAGRAATLAGACVIASAAAAQAAQIQGSSIALPLLGDAESPRLYLAQRVITRSWGHSEDSIYTQVSVPEWRSEGGAMIMSAALPGAGELYVGERSAWLFLLAEAGGWVVHLFLRGTADDRRDEAYAVAGDPRPAGSGWSLERWSAATQDDPEMLEQLFVGDPVAFYDLIRDPQYAPGFVNDASREGFTVLQSSADRRRRFARFAAMGLWLNHAISAFDALRAARIHNLPLRRNLELRIRPSLGDGGAGFTAAFEGSF